MHKYQVQYMQSLTAIFHAYRHIHIYLRMDSDELTKQVLKKRHPLQASKSMRFQQPPTLATILRSARPPHIINQLSFKRKYLSGECEQQKRRNIFSAIIMRNPSRQNRHTPTKTAAHTLAHDEIHTLIISQSFPRDAQLQQPSAPLPTSCMAVLCFLSSRLCS